MKTIKITKHVNLSLLTEQLFSAFPEWQYASPYDGSTRTDVTVLSEEITVPDDANVAAVQAVINAHNPGGKSVNQQGRVKEQAASGEFNSMPPWLKNATYDGVEQAILDRTTGDVSKAQALAAVDAVSNLDDVKAVLQRLVIAIYGIVEVQQKLARVILALVFFVRRRIL